MRCAVVLVLVLAACGGGQSPPDGGTTGDPPPLPVDCQGRCIIEEPVGGFGFEDCCDSVTCYLDRDTNEWVVNFCDPPLDPCSRCGSNEICVQAVDTACGITTTCEPRTVDCPGNACSPECEQAYCAGFPCESNLACTNESPLGLQCYLP